jgi:hypothetical protein
MQGDDAAGGANAPFLAGQHSLAPAVAIWAIVALARGAEGLDLPSVVLIDGAHPGVSENGHPRRSNFATDIRKH